MPGGEITESCGRITVVGRPPAFGGFGVKDLFVPTAVGAEV
jgi:hypothetical protein